jgi:hypothetical protein
MSKKCKICKGKGVTYHTHGDLEFPVQCVCKPLPVYGSPKYIEWFEKQLEKIKEHNERI